MQVPDPALSNSQTIKRSTVEEKFKNNSRKSTGEGKKEKIQLKQKQKKKLEGQQGTGGEVKGRSCPKTRSERIARIGLYQE